MTPGVNVVPVEERRAEVTGFDSPVPTVAAREVGAVAQSARGEAEIKAAIVLARNFPRDENAAYAKIMRSANRPAFAEGARYSFPRGGSKIEGPSVKLARELKRCWGNMDSGVRVLSIDEDHVHIQGYAVDFETNAWVRAEDKFARLVFRTKRGWVEPDERDLRELIFRRGSILERNCILQLMPPDIVEEAQRETHETLRKAAAGEIQQDREAAIRRIAVAYHGYGITTAMLSAYLRHDLALITDEELVDLRDVYTSIRDGQSRPDEHFSFGKEQSEGTDELNGALKAKAANGDTKAPPAETAETRTADLAAAQAAAKEQEPEDDGSPPSKKQLEQLEQLRKKSGEFLTRDDQEAITEAVKTDNGTTVRGWIKMLQKELARDKTLGGLGRKQGQQGGLGV